MATRSRSSGVWLYFDLGIDGDYDGLYLWLDARKARECGDNLAYFSFKTSSPDVGVGLKTAIKDAVKLRPRDRMYAIFSKPDGGYMGRFIVGGRTRAAWEGRAVSEGGEDEP